MFRVRIGMVFLALSCVFSGLAQAGSWSLGGYLDSVSINPDIATREGVGDTAWGLGFEGHTMLSDWFEAGGGIGLMFYDDKASFSQAVVGTGVFNDGDVSTRSSEVEGALYFIEMGPRYTLVENSLQTSVKFGFAGMQADRSISNCSDCYDENIDIDAGGYLQLGFSVLFNASVLDIKYNSYIADEGLDNSIRLTFRTRY